MSSPPLRIELRPSRWLRAALLVLTPLAALALLLSQAPWPLALILPPLALAWAWPRGHAPRTLVLRADSSASVESEAGEQALEAARLDTRGPLTVFEARAAGRAIAWVFAPDTLPASTRRELRLWARRHPRLRAAGTYVAHV